MLWAWVWQQIVVAAGQPISERLGVNIYIRTILAKYLPGSVWNYVGRAVLAEQAGLPQRHIWIATAYELILAISVGLTLSLWYVSSPASDRLLSPAFKAVALGLWFVSVLFISPSVFNRFIRHIAKRLRRPDFDLNLPFWKSVLFWVATLLAWLMIGVAFSCFVSSIVFVDVSSWPSLIVIWSLATIVSMLAIMFPQGIGIKEGFLTILLSTIVPSGIAVMIALASRVWVILCDVLLVLMWEIVNKTILNRIGLRNLNFLARKKY